MTPNLSFPRRSTGVHAAKDMRIVFFHSQSERKGTLLGRSKMFQALTAAAQLLFLRPSGEK